MDPRLALQGHSKDLGGGFVVRRLLPSAQRQAVGPFLFFDHFGPVTAQPGDDHDVRPHPHIGLATVTYLFEGAMQHRDSTGAVQRIEPGAINWMTAGRGIVHSERTPDDLRGQARTTHGLQLWAALPADGRRSRACFRAHAGLGDPGVATAGGAMARVLIGDAFGCRSPTTSSPTLYLDIALGAGSALTLPLAEERALYSVDAPFTLDGQPQPAGQMLLLQPGEQPRLGAHVPARVVLIGGQPLGRRFMAWNFVSSRKERIVQGAGRLARAALRPGAGRKRLHPFALTS
jgi:redox-sensitive bicupin YhaK (pirin superfamily)